MQSKIQLAVTGSYSIVTAAAMLVCSEIKTTSFQTGLIEGREALSLSTLKGTAKKYSLTYRKQADRLVDLLKKAGLAVGEQKGLNGKRILTIACKGEEI